MTNLPPNGNEPRPDLENVPPGSRLHRPWLRQLRRIGIPLGVITLAGVGGGMWWGLRFVNNDLAPLVEKNLSKSLKRPVNLGKVERFGLTSLRIGASSLPPTPTDPDRLSIQAIEVGFNPLRLLFSRDLNLDITAIQPEVYIEQAADGSWVETEISEEEEPGPIRTEVKTVRLQDARAVLVPWSKAGGKGLPVALSNLNGSVNFFDRNKRFRYELAGQSDTGGKLNLTGETRRLVSLAQAKPNPPQLETKVQVGGQNFLVSEIDRLVNLPGLELKAGRVNGNVGLALLPNRKIPNLTGFAQFEGVTLQAQGVPKPFTQAKGKLNLNGSEIRLTDTTGAYGKVVALVNGVADLDKGFNLTAQVKAAKLPDVVQALQLPLPFATTGEIAAQLKLTGPLQEPVLTGFARNTKLGKVDRVDLSQYSARFRLDTGNRLLTIAEVRATPKAGGLVTGGGRINLTNPVRVALTFDATNIPGDAIARGYNNGNPAPVTIGQLNAQTQISGPANNLQILTRWQAPTGNYPGSGEILIANGATTLRDTTLNVAGGTAKIQGQAANGRWQGTVDSNGIQLSRLSPDLRGLFSGSLALAGSLASLRPADVRAQGQVRLSEGISVIGQPLTAQVAWDGQKVIVQRATAPGFSADGAVFAKLEGPGTPAVSGLDLNVRVRNYDLQALALPVPEPVAYSGRADFAGRLTGTPAAPNIGGGLTLRQFVLNGLAFEPVLRGNLRVNRGVTLDVAGVRDRIAAVLDANYRPVAFDLRQGNAVATGRVRGDLLLVEAKNFPATLFNAFNPAKQFPLGGEINGNFAVNLNNYGISGQVAIAKPTIGTFRADQFGGRLSFSNGVATLSGAELRRGKTIFQLDGTASVQGTDPKFKGQLKIAQGRLQDLLELAQVFDLEDVTRGLNLPTYGNAEDLETVPVELENASVQNQIRRLSEVKALLAQINDRRQEAVIPELRELKGSFGGEVNLAGSLKTGINASFNLRGEDWQWGPYSAKQVVAIGTVEKGVVTLLPLRFQSDQSLIAFSGQIGAKQQSGQFRMENVPIETLKRLSPFPVPLEGYLNATAVLAGSLDNPQAIGEVSITDGLLNGKVVQQARGSFQYANARLDFGSKVTVAEPQPIDIAGSIPLRLPFASVFPESNDISLDINVKDDGLAVLNLLNNQVEWVAGKGLVSLTVRGTLAQPDAKGVIRLEDATLRARALPDPLTNVNGEITLERDRIIVQALNGKFSQGKVSASGVLPLLAAFAPTDPDREKPLTVDLDRLALNLKGLYRGAVNGKLAIAGSALKPQLGGNILLSNGEVLLSDPPEAGTTTTQDESPVDFNNLKLTLGDRIRITRAPILNFVAYGDLIINGSLNEPRPRGIINLRSGQVNLFATQFNLAKGYPQTAEFTERQGLDPLLDIRLIALVSEVTGSRNLLTTSTSEIADTPNTSRFGSLQSVRVQARIDGPASQLNDNLVLTSSPARSTSEIVSLIGGGFISTLGQGSGAIGLANLAGTALLTNVQGFIANTLGLSDFRLFPTITPNQDSRSSRNDSNLDLAMEAGFDITRALSVSVLKILTSDQPAQFGLRYRLNDNVLFRGSTDFSGDSRAVVEYETRF